ncbi:MAG: DUF4129 domain-containing protein [Candidatus Korarchaeota archaeon]|nr:DUF4129 domain-containing protein [Candidatus Korarchaeota archaeon]
MLAATWRVGLALLAAGLLLASAAEVGAPRLSEPLTPRQGGEKAPNRLLVAAGAIWALALASLALTAARNVGVLQAGGRTSWVRALTSLLSLALILAALYLSNPGEYEGLKASGEGRGFIPPDWLSNPPIPSLGVPASPGASRAGASLVLWAAIAIGLAVLAFSVVTLLRPGVSLFGGLAGRLSGREERERVAKDGSRRVWPRRRWEGARLQVIESYRSAVEHLRGQGVPMKPSWTPREHLEQVRRMGLPEASPLSDLERLFELARYSRRPVNPEHAELARRLSEAVRRGRG